MNKSEHECTQVESRFANPLYEILDKDIVQAGGHHIAMTNLQLIREIRLLREAILHQVCGKTVEKQQ